jgi:hypothetical protein
VASGRVSDSLVAVGFGILGLASIIYSLLYLVAQWAFGSLSPRLNLFRDDPIVWRAYGLAIGVFVFSLTAALAIGDDPEVSVVLPVVEMVGVLAVVALIRILLVRAFASIQLASALLPSPRGAAQSLMTCTASPAPSQGHPPCSCRRYCGQSPGRAGRPPSSNSTCDSSLMPAAAP